MEKIIFQKIRWLILLVLIVGVLSDNKVQPQGEQSVVIQPNIPPSSNIAPPNIAVADSNPTQQKQTLDLETNGQSTDGAISGSANNEVQKKPQDQKQEQKPAVEKIEQQKQNSQDDRQNQQQKQKVQDKNEKLKEENKKQQGNKEQKKLKKQKKHKEGHKHQKEQKKEQEKNKKIQQSNNKIQQTQQNKQQKQKKQKTQQTPKQQQNNNKQDQTKNQNLQDKKIENTNSQVKNQNQHIEDKKEQKAEEKQEEKNQQKKEENKQQKQKENKEQQKEEKKEQQKEEKKEQQQQKKQQKQQQKKQQKQQQKKQQKQQFQKHYQQQYLDDKIFLKEILIYLPQISQYSVVKSQILYPELKFQNNKEQAAQKADETQTVQSKGDQPQKTVNKESATPVQATNQTSPKQQEPKTQINSGKTQQIATKENNKQTLPDNKQQLKKQIIRQESDQGAQNKKASAEKETKQKLYLERKKLFQKNLQQLKKKKNQLYGNKQQFNLKIRLQKQLKLKQAEEKLKQLQSQIKGQNVQLQETQAIIQDNNQNLPGKQSQNKQITDHLNQTKDSILQNLSDFAKKQALLQSRFDMKKTQYNNQVNKKPSNSDNLQKQSGPLTEQTIATSTSTKDSRVSISNEIDQGSGVAVEKPLQLTLNRRKLFYLLPTIAIGLFLIYLIKRPISSEERDSSQRKEQSMPLPQSEDGLD